MKLCSNVSPSHARVRRSLGCLGKALGGQPLAREGEKQS